MVFEGYAQFYDVFYKQKDYQKECAYLQNIFKKHCAVQPKTVLDLGCGTGSHAIDLIKKGYCVTGVDASSEMLKTAREKVKELELKADFRKAKLQSFKFDKKFDAIICMFSVIDYVTAEKDLKATLRNVAKHMKKNSVFVFDFWNQTAVDGYYTPKKSRTYRFNGSTLERASTTKLYPKKQLCEVNYVCTVKKNDRIVAKDKETHVLRYFGIEQMKKYLLDAGLVVIDEHSFLNLNGKVRKNTWDVTFVAKKA